MNDEPNREIWVLGAAGRTGQAIAKRVQDAGFRPVLVGRDRSKLERVSQGLDGSPRLVVGTLAQSLVELAASTASVVISTVGPFVDTAPQVIAALPAGAHYVDINNEIDAIEYALSLHDELVAADRTVVSAAGFGVLGIEAALLHALDGMPTPARVRVDALPSVATEPGFLGAALAGTIIDGFRAGGRRVSGGKYVHDNPGSSPESITTPSGEVQLSGSFPSGELLTAWRASGAPEVMSAGSAMGLSPVARAVIPAASAMMRSARLRRFAAARLATMKLKGSPAPREFSWSRARVEWPDGTVRTGWLRSGEGMNFTADVAASVAVRLAQGLGTPGAFTPGALFGPSLATDLGAVLSLVEERPPSLVE